MHLTSASREALLESMHSRSSFFTLILFSSVSLMGFELVMQKLCTLSLETLILGNKENNGEMISRLNSLLA